MDCPEFLVDPPTLERLAEKVGLQLIWTKDFHSLYNDAVRRPDFKNLLKVMNVNIQTLSKSEWEIICLYQACLFRLDPQADGGQRHPHVSGLL